MSDQPLVSRSMSIQTSMFMFFLIFATIGGLAELITEGPAGEFPYALFATSTSTIIYGLAMVWVGTRLPGKWWGESILCAVIFYPIWLLMNAVSGGLDGEAFLTGLLYAAIAAVIAGVIFEILARAKD